MLLLEDFERPGIVSPLESAIQIGMAAAGINTSANSVAVVVASEIHLAKNNSSHSFFLAPESANAMFFILMLIIGFYPREWDE